MGWMKACRTNWASEKLFRVESRRILKRRVADTVQCSSMRKVHWQTTWLKLVNISRKRTAIVLLADSNSVMSEFERAICPFLASLCTRLALEFYCVILFHPSYFRLQAWASEGGGRARPPSRFWDFQQKRLFSQFFWEGSIKFHHFWPTWKRSLGQPCLQVLRSFNLYLYVTLWQVGDPCMRRRYCHVRSLNLAVALCHEDSISALLCSGRRPGNSLSPKFSKTCLVVRTTTSYNCHPPPPRSHQLVAPNARGYRRVWCDLVS